MTKRIIAPHKGGRTASLHIRMSPHERQRLDDIAAALEISVADIVERHAAHAGARLAMCDLQQVQPTAEVVLDGKTEVAGPIAGHCAPDAL